MSGGALLLLITAAVAQDAGTVDEKRLAQRLEERFAQQAKAYRFTLDAEGKQPLERHERPIMRWTADGNYGSVWIWTERGRPQLVGCIGAFQNNAGQLEGFHEFHLMSLNPIPAAKIGSDYVWEPNRGGPALKPISEASMPASTTRLRSLQMRQLAREFSADMKTDDQTHHLRLTPTPLFEYVSRDGVALEGALFSFLWDKGTDPELLLLIELQKTVEGERWTYAPIRFTWRELSLKRNDQLLWQELAQVESRSSRHLRQSYISCPVGVITFPPESKEPSDAAR